MNYRIYIQALDGFPVDENCMSAYLGFKGKGADIVFFEDIEEVPHSPYHVVVGWIGELNKYFDRLGIPHKQGLNVPLELREYAGRWVLNTTLGGARNGTAFPFFLKPQVSKQFYADVITSAGFLEEHWGHLPADTRCMISEVVDFKSEYRVYVIEGEIKGIFHYKGDIFTFPDPEVIKKCVADYSSAPVSYGIDFGVTSDGRTLLVEVNDGWSLGQYGLSNSLYAKLLATRWREIVKSY